MKTAIAFRLVTLGLTLFALCWLMPRSAGAAATRAANEYWVFLGTYTGAKSKGIYVCRLDTRTGKLTAPELAAEARNPSFLAAHPNHRFLYAVNEIASAGEKKGTGGVGAYAIHRASGQLTLLNQQSSGGGGPCHVLVDRAGKNVLVANYGGGSIAALPIKPDGSLEPATAFVQHRGSSVNPKRQQGPHAHGIYVDAANRFVFVPDLGLDQVLSYKFDATQGSLVANDPPFATVKPGAGPRHFAFHPNGRFGYVINELDSTITAFAYDAERGALKEVQTIGTLPADFSGNNTTAEIEAHPSGKFLYGSNRGHDSLAIYRVDADRGTLSLVGHQSTQGRTPRNFAMDPTGQFLLAGNQATDNLVVFRVDLQTGLLTPTGQTLEVGAPVCVGFVPLK